MTPEAPSRNEAQPFTERLRDDYRDLMDALRMLVAAASDTNRNMRDPDGACLDCGQRPAEGHDDQDCGMAGLIAVAGDARRVLRGLRVDEPPARVGPPTFEEMTR